MKEFLRIPEQRDYAPYLQEEKEQFERAFPRLTERGKKIIGIFLLMSSVAALSTPAIGSAAAAEVKREQPTARDLARDMGRSAVEAFRASEIADILYGELKSGNFGKTHEERIKNIGQLVENRVHLLLRATLQEKNDLTSKEMVAIWNKIGMNLADRYLKEYPPGMSDKPVQVEENFKALIAVVRNLQKSP